MIIDIESKIKVIYRLRTDGELDRSNIEENLRSDSARKSINIGYITSYDESMHRFNLAGGLYKELVLNFWEHYYIVLEDGYISGDLGSDGEPGAREDLLNHLMHYNDSYIELDDIIM